METPVISKKQAKKALSSKKKKTETIKNVLAQPFSNYWPLLSPEDNNLLLENLKTHLPRLKQDKITIPYARIRAIPKHERTKFRESVTIRRGPPIEERLNNNLVFGVNDVSKVLEDQKAGAVLVASDVGPRLLVQHVLDLCVLYTTPVVVVAGLRDVLKSKCGLSGVVVALTKNIRADSPMGLLQQTISNVWENYPVPENHINYNRNLEISTISIFNNSEICEFDDEPAHNFYLARKDTKTRVFVPTTRTRTSKTDFLSIDLTTPLAAAPARNDKKIKYKALSVKRLKGDKNRNKRKMERFSMKRKKK